MPRIGEKSVRAAQRSAMKRNIVTLLCTILVISAIAILAALGFHGMG